MSMKLMVRVMEEIDVTRPQQAVLLAMAENANDDGTQCYPSVDLIAWKAGYKPRAVSDILRDLRDAGIIRIVSEAADHRPTEYAIQLDRAPRKPPFEEWVAINGRYRERRKRGSKSGENACRTDEISGEIASRSDELPRKNASRHDELAREIASRDDNRHAISRDTACNLTSYGMQSDVLNRELARENAPEPVIDPVKTPSETLAALPRHGPAQTLVAILYEDVLGIGAPTSYDMAVGQAERLVKAGCTPGELREIATWLQGDPFWADKGISMGVILTQRDKWRSANRTPVPIRTYGRQPPNVHTHGHDDDIDWFGEYAPKTGG